MAKMTRTIILRPAARAAGLSRYFDGASYQNGYISERMTSTGACVACRRARDKRWRKAHPAKHQAKNNRWRTKSGYQWSAKFPEKRRKAENARYAANPDRVRAKNRAYHKAHPLIRRAINQRQRKLEIKGTHTAADIDRMFDRQEGRCLCGGALVFGFHVDHKTPLSRGGSNWPRNLQLLCPPCNGSKGIKTQREWLRSITT